MADVPEQYQFPQCLHPVAAAMHLLGTDPAEMVIESPFDAWWTVRCELERRYDRIPAFDGRGQLSDTFQCIGVTFRRRRA